MEAIAAVIQQKVTEALLSPTALLVAAIVNVVLLSGLGARLLDR